MHLTEFAEYHNKKEFFGVRMEFYYRIGIYLQIFMLAVAVSVDGFGAGFAYGVGKVRVPIHSLFIVSAVSSVMLGASLGAGCLIGGFLPETAARVIGIVTLLLLGTVKLFDCAGGREAKEANQNGDLLLSAKEALFLGVALSLDSIAAGIGVGTESAVMLWAIPAAFAANICMMWSGSQVGKVLSHKIKTNLNWVSGALLLLLAFIRAFR